MVTFNSRILFKACQTCSGDLYHNEDRYGGYLQCIQCSRIVELDHVSHAQDKKFDVKGNLNLV